ncbi:hypothetical protein QO200_09315 [Flavobacterium sp. Arc3]|uniref:hypothetical protein n=1 Tax=Flavobacterium sp. Arc3 TaxID=3046686 RepID=UPI00352CA7C4
MGILSFLFSNDPKAEIEACKKRILNFKKNIEIIKKNNINKAQAHYKISAKKNINTLQYQIEKEREKIKALKK